MDLISRETAIEALVGNNAVLLFDEATENAIKYVINTVQNVEAVPLDKLCVWLTKFGCPCEINEDMCDYAHGVDRCIGIFNSSAFCWKYWLTKMMEEQDAAD